MKKSATDLLLHQTDSRIWQRGEDYADMNKVAIYEFNDRGVSAVVAGTEAYRVSINVAGSGMSRVCSCPYFETHGEFCKHIVAVAIQWDRQRGLPIPTQGEVEDYAIHRPSVSRRDIDRLYDDPMNADLDLLRRVPDLTALGGRPRKHAKLPVRPKKLLDTTDALTPNELRKCFTEIRSWTRRSTYDPYFCAGEMVAAFCEVLLIVKKRLPSTAPETVTDVFSIISDFYNHLVVELIDDSQGHRAVAVAYLEELGIEP
jgi:hypothetical protein